MAAQTNPLVSLLDQVSSQLKSEEAQFHTTYTALESMYSVVAADVSSVTSALATNPSASQIYASMASQYSKALLGAPALTAGPTTATLASATNRLSSQMTVTPITSFLTSTTSTSSSLSSTSSTIPLDSAHSGLSAGAKVGLAIGIVLILLALVVLAVVVIIVMRKSGKSKATQPLGPHEKYMPFDDSKADLVSPAAALPPPPIAKEHNYSPRPAPGPMQSPYHGAQQTDAFPSPPLKSQPRQFAYELEAYGGH